MTGLRSVWHLVLTAHTQQQNIPIPGLFGRPIESLEAVELKQLAFRAHQLRKKWISPAPIPSFQFTITCDVLPTRLGVVAMQFLPRRSRYLLSLALASNASRLYSLQCWDLETNPPTCVAMRTIKQCGWFVINTDESSSALLAIQSVQCVIHILSSGNILTFLSFFKKH